MHTVIPSASHVNSGTSVPRDQIPWPDKPGRPIMKMPKPHVEVEDTPPMTSFGGLALVIAFVATYKVVDRLNEALSLLKRWHPYSEADHVLAQVLNLYVGGTRLEDMAELQHNEAVLRMLGAERLPDPTTGGDFLRRFDEPDEKNLEALRKVNDGLQEEVWKKLRKRHGGRKKKQPQATVDLDSHIVDYYGEQKEGADFSHKGGFGYQPLAITLVQTGEALSLINQPANERPGQIVAEELEVILPRLQQYFEFILVRGDSEFDRSDIQKVCRKHGAHFAFVGRDRRHSRTKQAMLLEEESWIPFRSRDERKKEQRRMNPGYKPRKKKPNRRRQRARERGYKELYQAGQWVAELPYEPKGQDATYRLILRRQLVENRKGQVHLFDEYRYHFIVTDLPSKMTMADVVDETYQRCDQENIIEQLGAGVAAWRMPVAEYRGNCAWLEMGRLAWNLGKWIAALSLPPEVRRWEWKRFRRAFVLVAARVVKQGRQIKTRISKSHRHWSLFVEALNTLRA